MEELTAQQLDDIANGACILASGGGGPISMKQPLIDILLAQNPVQLQALSALRDDDRVVVAAGAGSPQTAQQQGASLADLGNAVTNAFDQMEKALQCKFAGILAIETGVANTLLPMIPASRRGIPLLDGAGARRSVPTLLMSSFANLPVAPIQFVSGKGTSLALHASSSASAEDPMMAIITTPEFGSLAGLCFYPMSGATAKAHTSQGTVTYARKLGQALRESKANGQPVETVASYLGGRTLFAGKIAPPDERSANSFDFMTVTVTNQTGESLSIYAQNESLIAWNSALPQPVIMGPDLICYLTEDGEVFSNADLASIAGKSIAVIGVACEPGLRNRGVEQAFLNALNALGYAGPYVPFESLASAALAPAAQPRAEAKLSLPRRWRP